MKKKLYLKITSLILVICCLLSTLLTATALIPFSELSILDKETNNEIISDSDISLEEYKLLPIITGEDTSLRTEKTKVFSCDDGSYIAATYTTPIHYQDDEGNWCEIDNALTFTQDTVITVDKNVTTTTLPLESNKHINLKNGNDTLSWSATANFSDRNQVSIEKDLIITQEKNTKKQISPDNLLREKDNIKKAMPLQTLETINNFSLNATNSLPTPIISDTLKKEISSTNESINNYNSDIIRGVNYGTSIVEYRNAFGENTSVRYTLSNRGVKEDVILYKESNFLSYSISIDKNNLIATQNDNGSIIFSDFDNISKFIIDSPVMYDAADTYSDSIAVEIEITESDFIITYTPDSEWLNSKERVYPIIVDPYIHQALDPDMSATFVGSNKPTTALNYETNLRIGDTTNSFRNYGDTESWISLNSTPAIGFNGKYTITSAYIDFRIVSSYYQELKIDAFIPNAMYTDTVTWDDKPTDYILIASNISPTGVSGDKSYNIPLGTLPVQWEANSNARRFGVYLKASAGQSGCNLLYTPDAQLAENQPVYVRYYDKITKPTNETLVTNIATGYYRIKNVSNPTKYLSVSDNNYNVIASDFQQKWYIINLGNGKYSFTPIGLPNRRMEVHCGGYSDYRPINVYDYVTTGNTSSNAIQYYITKDSNNNYSIRPISNDDYALSIHQGESVNMFFYNWYVTEYRVFEKTQGVSCQLNAYGGYNWQKWRFSPTTSSDIEIQYKPEVIYQGTTYNIMTTADYQYVTVQLDDMNTIDDVDLIASNPDLVDIQKISSENKFKIKATAPGYTTIYLTDLTGNPCDSFELSIYNPTTLSPDSFEYTLSEMRGYRLDVPRKAQECSYTCGPACCIMVLNYKGITNISESEFFLAAGGEYGSPTERVIPLIGSYTQQLNLNISPTKNTYISNYLRKITNKDSSEYREIIQKYYEIIRGSLLQDCPVIVLVVDNTSNLLGYETTGHYIIVKALHKDSNGNALVDINDPFSPSTNYELTNKSLELLYDKNVLSDQGPGWNIVCNGTWIN